MQSRRRISERTTKVQNEAYICAADGGKNYYYLFSLLSHDDIPLVFVARDEDNRIYLCDCVEFRTVQRWTIAKTSFATLNKLVNQTITVYDALASNARKVDVAEYDYTSMSFKQRTDCDIDNLPGEYVPDKDAYIRYPEPDAKQKIRAFSFVFSEVKKEAASEVTADGRKNYRRDSAAISKERGSFRYEGNELSLNAA